MNKKEVKIPNMISGVSQQIPELRFPTQHESQENGLPTIKNGFGVRYPFEHISKLSSAFNNIDHNWHFIDRGSLTISDCFSTDFGDDFGDDAETTQYAVGFKNGGINAVNLKGNPVNVSVSSGAASYLATPSPKTDLSFITIQDFTFVLNKSITTAMKTTVDTLRPYEALVFVAQARVSSKYHVYINDVQQATFSSGTTTATVDIATNLEGDLLTNLDPLKFTVVRNGSTIYIASLDGVDFNIRTEEGDGGNTLKVFKGSTNKFSSLPALAVSGFRIKIENDDDFEEDNFWVEYESDSVTDQGSWKESRQDGLINIIDETTMPHQLIHNVTNPFDDSFTDDYGNDPFSLTPITWDDRLVGDDTTVPYPSFIDKKINGIFYMRNRLGFLAGENVIQSEDSVHTNFWTTTLQTLLDTEPIDVGTSHTKSSTFYHAVPTQERLLLFSEDTQFIYGSGDNVLSPKTTFINPSSEVEINKDVRPFTSNNSVFFAVEKKVGTTIKELSTDTVDDVARPVDITTHIPTYIPKDLQRIEGSNIDNLIFFLSNDEPGSLFIYKFLDEGKQRVLSSWHKWTVAGATINGMFAIKDNLYVIASFTEGSTVVKYLHKVNLSPDFMNTGLSHPLMLDRLITAKGIYNSTTGLTTWELPYSEAGANTFKVIRGTGFSTPGLEFAQSKITRPSSTQIAYPGDQSAGSVHIGKTYTTVTELTQPMIKDLVDGAPVVDRDSEFTVSGLSLDFFESAGFEIEVTYVDGTIRTYPYSGFTDAAKVFKIDQFNFISGTFQVPIRTRNDVPVTVKIKSVSYVPFNIYSGRWIMNLVKKRGRR